MVRLAQQAQYLQVDLLVDFFMTLTLELQHFPSPLGEIVFRTDFNIRLPFKSDFEFGWVYFKDNFNVLNATINQING